ncbi:ATP-binding protein [Sulfuriferula sp.]|uniref:ATP-binding protein n=1 Tax=Sulfuriferula sp. TaxID=2025307 RepID=UPI002730F66E|nr:ATP-binding protein [Sulfuriferula sp.]MDP2027559.1 ATP-binding protein [Sulfuriferula sp.]
MRSLKKQLIFWLAGLLTVVGVMAGGVSFYFALQEANGLLDHQLHQIARSVDEGSQLPAMQARYNKENEQERARDFIIQVWVENAPGLSSRPGFDLPRMAVDGFSTVSSQHEKWRVYTKHHPHRTVQVSQGENVRLQIATDSALRVLLPVAVLIPLVWLLVGIVVSRLLQPLESVTAAVAVRDAASHAPLPTENVPKEISPLILAMNDLIARLGLALELQRQFLADAAHELRTPLAALQLQIENLARNHSPEDLDSRIDEMRRGSHRASHLVAQLLKVARYEIQTLSAVRSKLDLSALVKACIADFIPLADDRGIDLGMIHDASASVAGNPDDLRILLGNLLDNAIRYTPEGGKVDVSMRVSGHHATIEILDNGPGIPAVMLPRVFDRFFRAAGQETEGSGIGLSIVQAIAKRESVQVLLANRQNTHGLIASAQFRLAE